MEGIAGIFQNVSKLSEEQQIIYLEGLLDHQSISRNRNDAKSLTQTINTSLSKEHSKKYGLQTLNSFLRQCSKEVFEEHVQFWTTCTIKALTAKNHEDCTFFAYAVLVKIAQRAKESNEFAATFAHTHLSKIYDSLSSINSKDADAALKCIEICLRTYPGPSGAAKMKIEQYLLSHINTTDPKLMKRCARCHHLLLQVRGGGKDNTTYRSQWQTYQLKLIGSLHEIMNEMFAKCTELNDYSTVEDRLELPPVEKSAEPLQRAMDHYIRFRNLLTYLTHALSEPFPTEKPIMSKLILSMLGRGINVNANVVVKNQILDNLILSVILPKIHCDLLMVLRALILCLGTHMKMFYLDILSIFAEILKWSSTNNVCRQKPFAKVRIEVYELLMLWCTISKFGNCCETNMDFFVKEIMYDISVQHDNVMQVQCDTKIQGSKKARKQALKMQNQESNIGLNHDAAAAKKGNPEIDSNRFKLCYAALRCLCSLIKYSGSKLQSATMNLIQKNVLETLYTIIDTMPLKKSDLYYHVNCRVEMYNVLHAIQLTGHRLCPPATTLAFDILTRAYQQEHTFKVKLHCGELLMQLEKMVHPQKEGLLFPIELRKLKCNFAQKHSYMEILQENAAEQSVDKTKQHDITAENNTVVEETISNGTSKNTELVEEEENEAMEEDESDDNEIVEEEKEAAVVEQMEEDESDGIENIESFEPLSKPSLLIETLEEFKNKDKPSSREEAVITEPSSEAKKRKLDDNDKLLEDIEAVFVDEFDD